MIRTLKIKVGKKKTHKSLCADGPARVGTATSQHRGGSWLLLGGTGYYLNPDTEKEGLPAGGRAPQESWPGSLTQSCPGWRSQSSREKSPPLTFSWPLRFVVLSLKFEIWRFLLLLALAFLVFFPFGMLRSFHCAHGLNHVASHQAASALSLNECRSPNRSTMAWGGGGEEAFSPWLRAPWGAPWRDFSVERVCERPAGASQDSDLCRLFQFCFSEADPPECGPQTRAEEQSQWKRECLGVGGWWRGESGPEAFQKTEMRKRY